MPPNYPAWIREKEKEKEMGEESDEQKLARRTLGCKNLVLDIFGQSGKAEEFIELADSDPTALVNAVDETIKGLTLREQRVLSSLYGIGDKDRRKRKVGEIATSWGLTEGRIRQIRDRALRKLRHPSRVRYLYSWQTSN